MKSQSIHEYTMKENKQIDVHISSLSVQNALYYQLMKAVLYVTVVNTHARISLEIPYSQ